MRLLSSWEQYLATSDRDGIQIHQYAASDIRADVGGATARLEVGTDYPWDGRVAIRITDAPDEPWTLTLRIPPNGRSVTITDPDGVVDDVQPDVGSVSIRRRWRADDVVALDMDLPPLSVLSDPRVDATRGCLAFERGPLVYCIETADIPPGDELEAVTVATDVAPAPVPRDDLGRSFVGLAVPASIDRAADTSTTQVIVGAIPYFAWANRTVEAMRVWIPTTSSEIRDGRLSGDPSARPDSAKRPATPSTDG